MWRQHQLSKKLFFEILCESFVTKTLDMAHQFSQAKEVTREILEPGRTTPL